MIIYVDLIFLENLIINFIILYVTIHIKKIRKSFVRILISSIVGSIYAILCIINFSKYLNNIISKSLLSILMIIIINPTKNVKKIIETLVVFYMISITTGGSAIAISYFIQGCNSKVINFPILISGIGVAVGISLIILTLKNLKSKISKNDIFYDVEIFIGGKSIKVKALLDTGNMLKEPITNKPVVIITKKSLKKIIPSKILDNINLILGGDKIGKIIDVDISKRLKIIPFNSLGKEHGILIGIKPDKIIVDTREIKNVIVGIYEKEFSKTKKYDALIGIDLLCEEECKYESNRKVEKEHKYNLC